MSVVTVEFPGQTLSLTNARQWAKMLNQHIDSMLVPKSGWYWRDRELRRESLLYTPEQTKCGIVQESSDGLFHCYLFSGQGCGIATDLNDAKYLVAQAIREQDPQPANVTHHKPESTPEAT